MNAFADIWVNNKIYTYNLPAGLKAQVGNEVVVSLRGKEKLGYILRLVPEPTFKTLPVIAVKDTVYFDEALVSVCFWMADYYKCFPETALKSILPKK